MKRVKQNQKTATILWLMMWAATMPFMSKAQTSLTVQVPSNCEVVVAGTGGTTGIGGTVGNGGTVLMPDPTPTPISATFTLQNYIGYYTIGDWSLSGDLSENSGGIGLANNADQSIASGTTSANILSYNENLRHPSEDGGYSHPDLARSKGRVTISYSDNITHCGGLSLSFDVYKTYNDNSYIPPIIGPDCWLPDSLYTYSVDQIASDNLVDGIGLDQYYWTVTDANGTPLPEINYYTSADKSSITITAPSVLNSPYTIEVCFGRGNPWDGNSGSPAVHSVCEKRTIGAQPTLPTVTIPTCLPADAVNFTASINSPVAGYTYHWLSSNSAWTPPTATGSAVTFGTLGTGSGTVYLTVSAGGCSSSEFHYDIGRTLVEPTTTITGDTCLSAGGDYTFEISNASQLGIHWILPSGWTINAGSPTNGNQSVVSVHVPNTATVSTATLQAWSCDNTVLISKTVYVLHPNPVISSPSNASVCIVHGDQTPLTFTVSPAGHYQWHVPNNWVILGTGNTESIIVVPDGNTAGTVTATGVGVGGCNTPVSALWTVDFNFVQPIALNTPPCWNFGFNADNVINVSNAPQPFYGTYTVTSSPNGLFSGYDVNTSTGAITLHTLATAVAGTYYLTITHGPAGTNTSTCPSQSATFPINIAGNGAGVSFLFTDSVCDYYTANVAGGTVAGWLVNGNPVTSGGNVTILGNTLILCGANGAPTSVCANVTKGGCTTRVCSGTLGSHGAALVMNGTASVTNVSSKSNVKVYPNPNSGSFTIEVPTVENEAVVEIYDVTGKLAGTRKLTQGTNSLKERLATGVYTLLFSIDGKPSVQKMVVE